ncbi:MEDS domain-containing protein [Mucilaginibacter sp. HMF5004]|uniref:MEDS domain-containing protein n=1 Tax=Mucilaginibacter rivuli TaxID=2857527 RepID=UPI001C5F7424|nr:MEDS domain-containing protein [Mucilaginibacter rivuli]MBW4888363.1 MEDS domain-containing protein [Mucilaginibacter rivuli]
MIKQTSLTVCGETHSTPMHICGFFDGEDERYDVILPYLKEGLENNDEILNILESTSYNDHCHRLQNAGIEVDSKLESGQLKVLSADDTYLQGGYFAADKMYKKLEDALISNEDAGYDSFRACGDMAWALKNVAGTDELIEYEAKLNQLVPQHVCSLICMYDINRFSARVLVDVLATHPYVILNGKIHKNPYYIEPIAFLRDLVKKPKRPLLRHDD